MTFVASVIIGWHMGIKSGVRFEPIIPAIWATVRTSPFLIPPFLIRENVVLLTFTFAMAVAFRSVISFPETSTILAFPSASKCVSSLFSSMFLFPSFSLLLPSFPSEVFGKSFIMQENTEFTSSIWKTGQPGSLPMIFINASALSVTTEKYSDTSQGRWYSVLSEATPIFLNFAYLYPSTMITSAHAHSSIMASSVFGNSFTLADLVPEEIMTESAPALESR